jgi:hypothetical protein
MFFVVFVALVMVEMGFVALDFGEFDIDLILILGVFVEGGEFLLQMEGF